MLSGQKISSIINELQAIQKESGDCEARLSLSCESSHEDVPWCYSNSDNINGSINFEYSIPYTPEELAEYNKRVEAQKEYTRKTREALKKRKEREKAEVIKWEKNKLKQLMKAYPEIVGQSLSEQGKNEQNSSS